jgi:hypothetical protein
MNSMRYCFITGAPGDVRKAWRKWAQEQPYEACFVPAQGGCFLVLLNAVTHSHPIERLQARASSLVNKGIDLEAFRTAFEEGRLF